MILVDVSVPIIEKKYDFWVDENMEIHDVCKQMSEMIASVERSELNMDVEAVLCDKTSSRVLSGDNTLSEYGIKDGAGLILV